MALVKEVQSFPDIKVQVVNSFPGLCVYITKSKSEAKDKDEVWCFEGSFPDKKISFVTSFPDLKVQYVESKSQAG